MAGHVTTHKEDSSAKWSMPMKTAPMTDGKLVIYTPLSIEPTAHCDTGLIMHLLLVAFFCLTSPFLSNVSGITFQIYYLHSILRVGFWKNTTKREQKSRTANCKPHPSTQLLSIIKPIFSSPLPSAYVYHTTGSKLRRKRSVVLLPPCTSRKHSILRLGKWSSGREKEPFPMNVQ